MPTEELGSIRADGGKVYLITEASLSKLLAAIKMQRPIAGNGIALDETPNGVIVKLITPPDPNA